MFSMSIAMKVTVGDIIDVRMCSVVVRILGGGGGGRRGRWDVGMKYTGSDHENEYSGLLYM